VLHVIGGAIYGSQAFKNVTVTGVILGTDGRKMSKNFKNYPDPREMLEKYGGDALRLYLLAVLLCMERIFLFLKSSIKCKSAQQCSFFGMCTISLSVMLYWTIGKTKKFQTKKSDNVLDEWILARLNETAREVTKSLDKYDTVIAIGHIRLFVDDLSTWYIRRSRERVGPRVENNADKNDFYAQHTQFSQLFVKLLHR